MGKESMTLNMGGRLSDIRRPAVMGIVNATPDSFYAMSRAGGAEAGRRALQMVRQGADIIDVGAYSTRPGAREIDADTEYDRLAPALESIIRAVPGTPLSVDTFRASVADRCIENFGPMIINDVGGTTLDPEIGRVAADRHVPYILMHMRGTPATMSTLTDYDDVVADVLEDLVRKADALTQIGVADVILDPGFGFAKTTEQNYELLAGLHRLCALGYPVLAGLSRKSMIYKVLDATPAESLAGTVALGWECLRQGAAILRVHDVREAVDTVRIFNAYVQNSGEICQWSRARPRCGNRAQTLF